MVTRRSREPMFVENPVVCVSGGVQPEMLSALAEEAGRRDGFLERFLFGMPDVSPARWTEAEIRLSTKDAMQTVFRSLRAIEIERPVKFAASARRRLWPAWYDGNSVTTRMSDGLMAGANAKMPNQVARIALVLHCIEHAPEVGGPLSEDTLQAAIAIAEYHRAEASRVFSIIGETVVLTTGLTARLMNHFGAAPDGSLTRSDMYKKLGGHVDKDELTDALASLASPGLITKSDARDPDRSGRRGERWTLVERSELNEEYEETAPEQPINSFSSFSSQGVTAEEPVSNECPCGAPVAVYDELGNPRCEEHASEGPSFAGCRCAESDPRHGPASGCDDRDYAEIVGKSGGHCRGCCRHLLEVAP